jgi:3-isopropylmalate/(R)-2-methylmalate dehydratase small subunit
MPFKSYRAAVSRALLFMSGCTGVKELVEDGDRVEVNFNTGQFINHTRGLHRAYAPLPDRLQEMIAQGGTKGMLRDWWEIRRKETA